MANLFDEQHRHFFDILNSNQVQYLLIGGIAVNIYGYQRGTGDVDIWVGSSEENKKKLTAAIEEYGYDTSHLVKLSFKNIILFSLGSRDEPGHIEIMNNIAGIQFLEAYENVENIFFEEVTIKCIHIKDLIKNKKASGRYKDLDDVENLQKILDNQKDRK